MSLRSLVLGAPLLAGLALLSGCVLPSDPGLPSDRGAEPDEGELGTSAEPIAGGYDDVADTNVVDMIWYVNGAQGYSECSGSLLAPNMVLTAHHCVATPLNEVQGGIDCAVSTFSKPDPAKYFYVSTAPVLSQDFPDGFNTVAEVLLPPGGSTFCGQDQAILILKDPLAGATPLIPRVDSQIADGDTYSAIGYGNINSKSGAGTRRRLDHLTVKCVGPGCGADGSIMAAHEFIGDHGTCEGDSGGPAIDSQNRVIGVTSRGATGCVSSIYGDVFSWAAWIKSSALHAAQIGGYDPPPWATGFPTDQAYNYPVGGACPAAPATCASDLCLNDAAGSYCTRACEEIAPCPDGYTCEAIQGQTICQRIPPAVKPSKSATTSSGCATHGADPTKPVPWRIGAGFALAGLALLRRGRRRATVRG